MDNHKSHTFPSFLGLVPLLMSFLVTSRAYDIGCIYPPELGDDPIFTRFDFGGKLTELVTTLPDDNDMTQPYIARFGLYVTGCTALCLAFHDPLVKDPFTKFPTFVTVPPFGRNAYSVTMCQAQCWQYVWTSYYDMMPQMKGYFQSKGLSVGDPFSRMDIVSGLQQYFYFGNSTEITSILQNDDFHPFTIGHIAGMQVKQRLKYDGFNEEGEMMWDPSLQAEVSCTANCIPFQPTTGYQPRPDPRKYSFLDSDTSKYDCTGMCRNFQPELDMGTPTGTISRKEITLPHIGYKATPYLRDATSTLQDPNYDYYQESLDVVERLRQTSSDDSKKLMIKLFRGLPNKGMHGLRGTLQLLSNAKFSDQITYQDNMLLFFALSLIEYDGIIQVWKEKLDHDLVRPSTVIQQWGDDTINTFGGDIDSNAPQDISARNFRNFINPIDSTPEFPSIHSCFCTTLMEFMDLYLDQMYGDTLQDFSFVVPGEVESVTFQNMEEYRDKCSESQLWGGFNYPASVTAGEDVCSGLGTLAVEYIEEIKNGSNFNGGWQQGDKVPECPNLQDGSHNNVFD